MSPAPVHAAPGSTPPIYSERLLPGWGACTVMVALLAMIAIAYGAAFGATLGWALFSGLAVLAALAIHRTAPVIRVTTDGLQADGAHLPWRYIGSATALDGAQMRAAHGPAGDPRRYLVLRSWAAAGGVLVHVRDPTDPHPAWLLSSRHPKALAHAIQTGHQAG